MIEQEFKNILSQDLVAGFGVFETREEEEEEQECMYGLSQVQKMKGRKWMSILIRYRCPMWKKFDYVRCWTLLSDFCYAYCKLNIDYTV